MKALFAVLLLAALGAGWYFYWQPPAPAPNSPAVDTAAAMPSDPRPAASTPDPLAVAGRDTPFATASAASSQPAAALPAPTAALVPVDEPQRRAVARLISQSQLRAVARHPALAQANSELNSRFVSRYKALKANNDLRLQQPDWPERLAEECAAETRPANAKSAPASTGSKVVQSR